MFIYLLTFYFNCAGLLVLSFSRWPLSSCGVQASHCGGFSCCGARALECMGLSSCAHGLSCPIAHKILPDQGSNPCPLHCRQILNHWTPRELQASDHIQCPPPILSGTQAKNPGILADHSLFSSPSSSPPGNPSSPTLRNTCSLVPAPHLHDPQHLTVALSSFQMTARAVWILSSDSSEPELQGVQRLLHPPPPTSSTLLCQTGYSGSFLFRFWGCQYPIPHQMCCYCCCC